MVSVYVKAAVITLVLFVGNFFLVKYIDESRAADIASKLDEIEYEMQNERTLLLYAQTVNSSSAQNLCPALEARTRDQINRIYDVLARMQQASAANVLSDIEKIKRRYVLMNSELWLYVAQLNKLCGATGIFPILYFYPDRQDCLECRAQADVLNAVRDECKNIRIFAFPTDMDIGIVEVIKRQYSVNSTPTIVVNETVFRGLTPRSVVLGRSECRTA